MIRLLPHVVLAAHTHLIEAYGGDGGMRGDTSAILDGALGGVFQEALLRGDFEPTRLGARYCARIAMAHAFLDGNKRTAAATMLFVWNLSGYELPLESEPESLRLILALLADHRTDDAFVEGMAALARRI